MWWLQVIAHRLSTVKDAHSEGMKRYRGLKSGVILFFRALDTPVQLVRPLPSEACRHGTEDV